jgi:hypothetical protein
MLGDARDRCEGQGGRAEEQVAVAALASAARAAGGER